MRRALSQTKKRSGGLGKKINFYTPQPLLIEQTTNVPFSLKYHTSALYQRIETKTKLCNELNNVMYRTKFDNNCWSSSFGNDMIGFSKVKCTYFSSSTTATHSNGEHVEKKINEIDLLEQNADDIDSLEKILNKYCSIGNLKKAVETLYKMEKLSDKEESKKQILNENNQYPQSYHYSSVIESFAKHTQYNHNIKDSKIESSPQTVQALLEHMEQISQSTTTKSSWKKYIQPTISCYNNVMKTWVASRNMELKFASRAQSVFDQMMKKKDQNKTLMPNIESYEIIIHAWCHSKEGGASFKATSMLKHMEEYVKDQNANKANNTCDPSLEIYKTVLACLARSSRHKTSAIKSENIINKMIQNFKIHETNVKPDLECYRYVLQAWSKSTSINAANRSERLLTIMKQNQVRPDHECYAKVIQMLSKSSTSFNNAAERADHILTQMEESYEKIDVALQPTWNQYHDVITAWARNRSNHDAPIHAMSVFHRMEHLQNEAKDDFVIIPNMQLYTAIMSVFSRSTSNKLQNRARKAHQLHQQMLNEYLSGNEKSKPTVHSYNILLEACALSKHDDEKSMQEAFGIAVDVLQELRDSFDFGNPNNVTYRLLLDCCYNLLPPGNKKLQLIEKTFQNCCRDGLVDKVIIQKIRQMVPHWLYNRMVLLKMDDTNKDRKIPTSWTCNLKVKNSLYKHDDIFISGTNEESFVTTKGNNRMDQMKGLRGKMKQKLLRGGRIQV